MGHFPVFPLVPRIAQLNSTEGIFSLSQPREGMFLLYSTGKHCEESQWSGSQRWLGM